MKEDLYDDLYLEEKEEKTDFKAVLFKYTAGIQHLGVRHHQRQ